MNEVEMEKIFTQIAQHNIWESEETKSGPGSTAEQTEVLRRVLPEFLLKHRVRSMLDIPCGDFHWMKLIKPDLANVVDSYTGGDIVKDIVERNTKEYSDAKFRFELLDITSSMLPKTDLIFSRDVLVHFSYQHIFQALCAIKESGSTYFLTTSFTEPRRKNRNIPTGQWRPLNLQRYPFLFGAPVDLIVEQCSENDGLYQDKSLLLWDIKKIDLTYLKIHLLLSRIKKNWYSWTGLFL